MRVQYPKLRNMVHTTYVFTAYIFYKNYILLLSDSEISNLCNLLHLHETEVWPIPFSH